jgi:hypothetical protein
MFKLLFVFKNNFENVKSKMYINTLKSYHLKVDVFVYIFVLALF